MGSPAPGEPGPPSSGTPVPACVPPPSCRMPHRRGRARRPVHSRARPAAPPQRRTRAAAAVVRLSRRRYGAARREALGASRLASTARVRPPQPVPVRMFVPNLPVSEPSSGLLTKYGSNPDLSPTPTCALNPDSPCPYPLRTGRPYTRTSCVRPLYAGPLARSHSAGPAFARHVTLRVESVSPHRPRRRCGMLYTYFVLVVYCVTSAVSLSFCPVTCGGDKPRTQSARARGRKQTNFRAAAQGS